MTALPLSTSTVGTSKSEFFSCQQLTQPHRALSSESSPAGAYSGPSKPLHRFKNGVPGLRFAHVHLAQDATARLRQAYRMNTAAGINEPSNAKEAKAKNMLSQASKTSATHNEAFLIRSATVTMSSLSSSSTNMDFLLASLSLVSWTLCSCLTVSLLTRRSQH